MEWGWVLIYGLAILGAAAVVGGVVAYRGSARPGVRAFAAASVASGVMMLMIVTMVVPVTYSDNESPQPEIGFQSATQ
jgi:zinc transporter ZupT